MSFWRLKKITDRASFQTKLRLTATDLKVGYELNGKLFKRRFKIRMQEKSDIQLPIMNTTTTTITTQRQDDAE